MELAQVQKQTSVNQEFLAKMESDPQLTERLAQREMHAVEQGEAIVNMKTDGAPAGNSPASAQSMSPFTLVNIPPPAALAPYQPVGGVSPNCAGIRGRTFTFSEWECFSSPADWSLAAR